MGEKSLRTVSMQGCLQPITNMTVESDQRKKLINKNPDLCIYSFAGNQQMYVLRPF